MNNQPENKPNLNPKNFREAALSHIPFDLIQSMEKQTEIKASDLENLKNEVIRKGPAIRASIPCNQVPVLPEPSAQPIVAQKPAFMSYAIEGHVINVPTDRVGAAISLFYTLLTFVWSKDKKVAKILKQLDFKFLDSNKQQIYPRKGKKR